jgi:hypothetical protein
MSHKDSLRAVTSPTRYLLYWTRIHYKNTKHKMPRSHTLSIKQSKHVHLSLLTHHVVTCALHASLAKVVAAWTERFVSRRTFSSRQPKPCAKKDIVGHEHRV